jgi:hypothetical protein
MQEILIENQKPSTAPSPLLEGDKAKGLSLPEIK